MNSDRSFISKFLLSLILPMLVNEGWLSSTSAATVIGNIIDEVLGFFLICAQIKRSFKRSLLFTAALTGTFSTLH